MGVQSLSVGKTITVTMQDPLSNSSATQAVTLVALKTATSVPQPSMDNTETPNPGNQYVFLEFTIKDTGSTVADPSAFAGATNTTWVSSAGQAGSPTFALGVSGGDVGMSDQEIMNLPKIQPGQFSTGTTVVEMPTGSRVLTFADSSGTNMFSISVH